MSSWQVYKFGGSSLGAEGRLPVVLRRGEARRVHRRQLEAVHGERLACGAEIDEHRIAVIAHVDVARLDVEV